MADNTLPPLPKNHLDHPEQWTTGAEPATEKQKGFVEVLQKQHPELVPTGGIDTAVMGKSEASEVIDKLRNGEKVDGPTENKVDEDGDIVKEGNKGELAAGASQSNGEQEKHEDGKEEGNQAESKNTAAKRKAATDADSTANADAPTEAAAKDARPSRQTKLDELASGDPDAHPAKKAKTADAHDAPNERQASASSAKDDTAPTTPTEVSVPPSAVPRAAADQGATNDDTVPGDGEHLDHPENWATGDDPATDKQKGFIKVLEKQKGMPGLGGEVENLGKSEASEKIEELKQM